MYGGFELTPEEEEEIIKRIAEKINNIGFNEITIPMLKASKPFINMGVTMGQILIFPFIAPFSEKISREGETISRIFNKKENLDKLISILETKES